MTTQPASIFSGLSNLANIDDSILKGVSRAPQRNPLNGEVLFHDTFDEGFCGWRDHYGGGPSPAISLTSYPVFSGSHALMIGASPRPDSGYTAGWSSGQNAATFKNLSRYYNTGLLTFSAYLTHRTNPDTSSLGSYGIVIDTQSWDNTIRSYFQMQVVRNSGTGGRSVVVYDNTQSLVYVDLNAASVVSGDNENKFNWDWISLTVDLSANSGLGGYHSAQINNTSYDLTGVGGQNAHMSPQAGSAAESFAGGLNFGIIVVPGPAGTVGNTAVYMDEAVATVNEVTA